MRAESQVLPRARRKRRKPMSPLLKLALMLETVSALLLFDATIRTALGHDGRIGMAMNAIAMIVWWPILTHEWNRWKQDDDP